MAPRARARARAKAARPDSTAHSGTWVSASRPLAEGNQASPQPKPASPARQNLVPRSGQTRQGAALTWARTRGCFFGCGLAAVHGSGVYADLRRQPHQGYPRAVYSEQCPYMFLRIATKGVGSGLG